MSIEFIQTGITTDNKMVIAGVYSFYETEGLPLDIILDLFIKKNAIPDWIDFYNCAIKSGMKHSRIISKLYEAISDTYGSQCAKYITEILDRMIVNK